MPIRNKDEINKKLKDLWKEHKFLLIIIIPCLLIFMGALFGKSSDVYSIRFNNDEFDITDSVDDIKNKYQNDYNKEYSSFYIYNDGKKESMQVYYNGSEIEAVENSNSKSAILNGISIGDNAETMSEKLDIDEAWFEDKRITLVCYKDGEMINKARMNVEDYDPEKMISEVNGSDYILAIAVEDSKADEVGIWGKDYFVDLMEETKKANKALEESSGYDSDDSYDNDYDDSDSYDNDYDGTSDDGGETGSVTGSGSWQGGIAE